MLSNYFYGAYSLPRAAVEHARSSKNETYLKRCERQGTSARRSVEMNRGLGQAVGHQNWLSCAVRAYIPKMFCFCPLRVRIPPLHIFLFQISPNILLFCQFSQFLQFSFFFFRVNHIITFPDVLYVLYVMYRCHK